MANEEEIRTETADGSTAVSAPTERSPLGVGSTIKHYELIRKLGEGGMGAVFLARDTKLGRLVAVKVLLEHRAGRFLIEARATARCQHENIVVIYEVNEINGTPYMVLEYLEGRTLRDWMRSRARPEEGSPAASVAPSLAVEVMIPVVRALGCAHHLGIVHRDLKPENIFMTDAGRVVVLDFGIAKQIDAKDISTATGKEEPIIKGAGMTEQGALMGTLPYMSPEQWATEGVDLRSDLWAVGIMLHELVTGEHPLSPLTAAKLARVVDLDRPMPSVSERRLDLGALGAVIDRCLKKRKEERFESTEELSAALLPLLPGRQGLDLGEGESPFAGLSAFQEADAARFFGREHEVAALIGRLRSQRLVIVTGPSGAGKSSFVRAGVIPALKRSGERWEAHVLRPGQRPLAALAEVVAQVSADSVPEDLVAAFHTQPGLVGARLRARCRRPEGGSHILLFVDQFEELYTLGADPEEQATFIACLEGAADDAASPLRVILSVRSDFLDRLADDRRLMAEVTRGLSFLPSMGRDALREALTRPTLAAGHRFESEDMVEDLLGALEHAPSPLPLMQFAAAKLWETRDRARRLLTLDSYESYRRSGGLGGALAGHADAVLRVMSKEERSLSRAALLRLVTPERTRAVHAMRELCELGARPGEMERVLGRLIEARLLIIEGGGEAATVEIVHESLITGWPTLAEWLAENQADAVFLARLRNAAREWEAGGRSDDLLWRGQAAEGALRWYKEFSGELAPLENAYLRAVEELGESGRRSRRRIAAGLFAALAAIVVVVSILAVRASRSAALANEALGKATDAEKDARDKAVLASDARLLAGFRELKNSGQLAWATKLLPEVEGPAAARGWVALASDALATSALFVTLRGHDKALSVAVWSHDGKRVLTASADRTARVWSADGEGVPIVLEGHEGAILSAAWSPDDARVVTASEDRTARVFRADGAGQPIVLEGHEGAILSAAWSPDGARVVTASADKTARVFGADGSRGFVQRGHTAPVTTAAFHPDGERVITASADRTARVWRLDGKGEPVVLRGHNAEVVSLAVSPDGTRVVTTSRDKTARIWDVSGDGRPVVLEGHEGSVEHAAWGPDGARVATASADRTARVWRADGKGDSIVLSGHGQAVTFVAFRPDGRYVLTASRDQVARVWPAEGGAPLELRGHEAQLRCAAWSPDGTRVLTASGESGRSLDSTARIWRPTSLESLPRERRWFFHSAFTGPGGLAVVSAYDDDTARLWRVDGKGDPVVFKGHRGWVASAAQSPDGKRVVTASFDRTARVWDASGQGDPVVLEGHEAAVRAAAFSPDGTRVVTASDDRTARVWSADGRGEPVVLAGESGHQDGLTSAAWSPDGARVVTTSMDHTARVWRPGSADKPMVLEGHGDTVHAAAVSPDGARIVTASEDGTAQVWSAESGAPLFQLDHGSPVLGAIWSPDGKRIATSSPKGLHVWSADGKGEPIEIESPAPVIAMAFVDGGRRILTVAADNTTRTLTIDVGALRQGLAAASADCLPEAMRATYLGEPKEKAGEQYTACECQHRRAPALVVCREPAARVDAGEPLSSSAARGEDKPRAPGPRATARPRLGAGERRVAVMVLPGDASVEVDGQPVRRRNGVIELVGKAGEVHRVRVFKGAKSTEEKAVTIQEAGATPALLDLNAPVSQVARGKAAGKPVHFGIDE
jgi:WD40 repeat protein/tRNA A-37 threonylcarbamoyl transferase component Bud32